MTVHTDIESKLIDALVIVANDSTTLAELTGRTTKNMIPWQDLGTVRLPAITYFVVTHNARGGAGDNRNIVVQFTAFAEGRGAANKVRAIIEVLETLFSYPAMLAAGVDAFVVPDSRNRPGVSDEPDGATNRRRADLEMTFWATK